MKNILTLIILLNATMLVKAQTKTRALASRSDSLDIIHTVLSISNINNTNASITGNAKLLVKSKINNLSELHFDLAPFNIDSILVNGQANSTYTLANQDLKITIPTPLQNSDSLNLEIFYNGSPVKDATWGGFYFSGSYAFSMGVGFTSQPHSVGRYLFPCFDNFVERSSYEFYVETDITNTAACNGLLLDSVSNNGKRIWHWKLNESIPSYLVSVAVAPYTWVLDTLQGVNGNMPVAIACLPADTSKVKASFANLQKSFTMLEEHFGPYQWNKVGYSLVPFTAGAMEHATNIHIGVAFIDGTLNYETLIAHELSHHWFGDLTTCDKAQEMWLNEGYASYCELLHTEFVYDYEKYLNEYKQLHYNVLSSAHISDKAYQAINNVDSLHTYGPTVYSKGSIALHTMRYYMGDTNFFDGHKQFLNQYSFKDVNTPKLNQALNTATGKNWNSFFNDWIKQPGFINVTIDSVHITPKTNSFDIDISIRQRKHQCNNYYEDIKVPICFYKSDYTFTTSTINLTERCKRTTINIPFEPVMISIDDIHQLSDASTSDVNVYSTIGTKVNTLSKMRFGIRSISDSVLLRSEHHWVAPDRNRISLNGYILNNSRYWRIDGINLSKVDGIIGLPYDITAANNYLDSTWLKGSESNIKIFYRKDATENWTALQDSLGPGPLTDKRGVIYAKQIKNGDYALAYYDATTTDLLISDAPIGPCTSPLTIDAVNANKALYSFYPNPSNASITIKGTSSASELILTIYDSAGKIVFQQNNLQLDTAINLPIAKGSYTFQISCLGKAVYADKLILN
jgi:hypothetical protein